MVLLSCSGTGGICAKLANGAVWHNCARASPTHNSVAHHCADQGFAKGHSIDPRKRVFYRHQLPNCRRKLSPHQNLSTSFTCERRARPPVNEENSCELQITRRVATRGIRCW